MRADSEQMKCFVDKLPQGLAEVIFPRPLAESGASVAEKAAASFEAVS
jgi:hypothetical protein